MGSDRDYSHKYSGKNGGRRARSAKRSEERMKALIALEKSSKMTREDARRIQSSSDKSGKNQDFKARAMSAAEKNEDDLAEE